MWDGEWITFLIFSLTLLLIHLFLTHTTNRGHNKEKIDQTWHITPRAKPTLILWGLVPIKPNRKVTSCVWLPAPVFWNHPSPSARHQGLGFKPLKLCNPLSSIPLAAPHWRCGFHILGSSHVPHLCAYSNFSLLVAMTMLSITYCKRLRGTNLKLLFCFPEVWVSYLTVFLFRPEYWLIMRCGQNSPKILGWHWNFVVLVYQNCQSSEFLFHTTRKFSNFDESVPPFAAELIFAVLSDELGFTHAWELSQNRGCSLLCLMVTCICISVNGSVGSIAV